MKRVLFFLIFWICLNAEGQIVNIKYRFWVGDSLLDPQDVQFDIAKEHKAKINISKEGDSLRLEIKDNIDLIYIGFSIQGKFYDFIGGISPQTLLKYNNMDIGIANINCSKFIMRDKALISKSPYRLFVALNNVTFEQVFYEPYFKLLPRKLKRRLKKCPK